MLGNGVMVFWHDFAPGSDVGGYHEWHSKEHIEERVRIPGFRRGYRYARLGDEADSAIFLFYEVDDLEVLTSAPYLERLNDPTPWTRRSMTAFANNNRTLCRVVADLGAGITGFCLTLQVAGAEGSSGGGRSPLAADLLRRLVETPGIVGASLLEGDAPASRTETEEKRIRGIPDQIADLVLIVRGYDPEALRAVRDGELARDRLGALGVGEPRAVGLYQLLHSITDVDLRGLA